MPEVTTPIRVAVVDDQRLFSSGMAMLIEAQTDLVCVGTALNGQQAIALVEQEHPDVILMDLRMPVINGLEATRLILENSDPDGPPRIIALTTIRKDEAVYSALAAGASAFLTKDAEPEIVLATIRAAHAGAAFPTDGSAVDLVRQFASPEAEAKVETAGLLDELTERERHIFGLVAQGLSNAEIAATEYVTEATVKSHVRSMLAKLRLRSRIQVVIFAYENALVGA